jgi:hypothetical protein
VLPEWRGAHRGAHRDGEQLAWPVRTGTPVQRAAWTIGDHINTVIETRVNDLTNDEATVLVHFGGERTEQLLLGATAGTHRSRQREASHA